MDRKKVARMRHGQDNSDRVGPPEWRITPSWENGDYILLGAKERLKTAESFGRDPMPGAKGAARDPPGRGRYSGGQHLVSFTCVLPIHRNSERIYVQYMSE